MDATIAGFFAEITVWHWWTLAAVLLVLELSTGTTYLLWPAASASVVGLLVAIPIPFGWELQLLTFAVITTVLTMTCAKFVRERWTTSDKPNLNRRVDQLTGQKVVAVSAFVAGIGTVKVGDTVWRAQIANGDAAADGDVLEITGMDGVTLAVRRT